MAHYLDISAGLNAQERHCEHMGSWDG